MVACCCSRSVYYSYLVGRLHLSLERLHAVKRLTLHIPSHTHGTTALRLMSMLIVGEGLVRSHGLAGVESSMTASKIDPGLPGLWQWAGILAVRSPSWYPVPNHRLFSPSTQTSCWSVKRSDHVTASPTRVISLDLQCNVMPAHEQHVLRIGQ